MDLTNDDFIIITAATLLLVMLKEKKEKIKKRPASIRVSPYLKYRNTKGRFAVDVSFENVPNFQIFT